MSNTYPQYQPGPQQGMTSYPGQSQQGQRFPNYQPPTRGPSPPQPHMANRNPTPQPYMPQPGMMPGQTFTYHIPPGPMGQVPILQYHSAVPFQPQPQYPNNGQRSITPAGGQVMTPGAQSFNPGGQYGGPGVPVPYQHHGHHGQMASGQPNQTIYSAGHPPTSIYQGHPSMGMYGPRFASIPQNMMNQQMQQSQHMHQQVQGPPQGQMPPQQQGGPPGQHPPQGAPPIAPQHSQQQPQSHIYQSQPHRPQVSISASMNSMPTGGPPPATTPPTISSGPPSLPQQNISSQPPSTQNTLSRVKKRIAIINPDTGMEVSVGGTSKASAPTASVQASEASPEPTNSTSNTPAPAEPEKAPKATGGVAAEFAAKVAAAAEGAGKKEASVSPGEEILLASEETTKEAVVGTNNLPAAESTGEIESTSISVSPTQVGIDSNSTLSVSTDLKREEPMYEPVSPTPLPDSPLDENKMAEITKPSPFEEVINKKAGVVGIERRDPPAEEAFVEAKLRPKKKQSAASKRAALNSKGEKKGDLLDVFTSNEEKTAEQIPTVTKKSPTPEPNTSALKEEAKVEVPPTVDEVSQMMARTEISDNVETPTEATTDHIVPCAEEPKKNVDEDLSVVDATKSEVVADVVDYDTPKVNGILDSIPPELRRSESSKSEQNDDLEEGEIIDDDCENQDDSKSMKLKYDYKEDQWSPLNPEGKKQYGREFLICLQRDPLSLQKPCNLPSMEIVKDKPNLTKSGGAAPRFDFTPGFVIKSTSQRGPGKGTSRDGGKGRRGEGRDQQQKPRMVISLPSISQEVKLNKAENAWKPALKEKKEGLELTEMEELKKKVLAILNKLTPQKFETLVNKFQELPIDTYEKLAVCMELVFEKAVDEPAFSVAYAQMCKVMQMKKVMVGGKEDDKEVNFRKLLISRCQKEFEKDYMENLDRTKYRQEMNAAEDEDTKKRIQMEFEQQEMKLRRRSLGNIRFIGELYKLGMLTARIMHECVKKLLTTTDEESLECLCRLVTTVGQDLDAETTAKLKKGPIPGINNLDVYFKEMNKIVAEKKTSSRVRFLMQDVIELRLNDWKKRREDAGPKTIDQIHKEIEKEQLEQQIKNMSSSMGPPPRGRDDRGRNDKNERIDRRSSQKGPSGGVGGGHSNQEEGGWTNVPTKVPRSQGYEKIDTNKLKNIQQSTRLDVENITFGPQKTGGPGSFGSWGRGSQSAKTSRQEQTSMQNRFAQLDQNESGPPQYDGRNSGNRYGRQNSQQDRSYSGRNSRGLSSENDRAKAIQAAREFGGNRSQSVMGPPPSLSRENSTPRSASMVVQKKSEIPPEIPLMGSPNATDQEIRKWTTPLLNEFLHNVDYNEAIKEIGERFSVETIAKFVEEVLNEVIERSEKDRHLTGELLSQLVKKRMLTEKQCLEGFNSLLSLAEDLLVDIPKFWDFMAHIIAPVISSEALELRILKESATLADLYTGEMGKRGAPGKYTAAVLHEMGKSGQSLVAQMWKQSGLQWSDFLSDETSLEEFLKSNKLEWTVVVGGDVKELNDEDMGREIAKVIQANRKSKEAIMDWIDKHCASRLTSPRFIRVLATVLMESVIDGIGGPSSMCKLNEDQLRLIINPVIKKYLDTNPKLELQALIALQYLMHRLEQPSKLLHSIFEKMYDDDVLTEDAFFQWEKHDDPADQVGKGVALKSCTQFFTWLKEADVEEEEEG